MLDSTRCWRGIPAIPDPHICPTRLGPPHPTTPRLHPERSDPERAHPARSHPARSHPALSVPGIAFAQLLERRALRLHGIGGSGRHDTEPAPSVAIGHSQGLLAAAAATGRLDEVDALALAHLIGTSVARHAVRTGLVANGSEHTPMLAVSGITEAQCLDLLDEFNAACSPDSPDRVVLGVVNGPARLVLVGRPERLAAVQRRLATHPALDGPAGRAAPRFEPLEVAAGFHHPALAIAVDEVVEAADSIGISLADSSCADASGCPMNVLGPASTLRHLVEAIVSTPFSWIDALAVPADDQIRWLVDLGPDSSAGQLARAHLAGTGVGVCGVVATGGVSPLLTPGAAPSTDGRFAAFAPTLRRLPDDTLAVDTKLTRLTGQSPFILAGMTPTTVDATIVAAAANAGHWAELAGGGQVTTAILTERLRELDELLDEGIAVHFNTLYLDPYLWGLHFGETGAVVEALRRGAPIRGVTVSAGIPDLDEAVALVERLGGLGVETVTFKPGTVDGIRRVVAIADAVAPTPIVAHVEGGLAGGHHSWEQLDELLLATYADLRRADNLVVCVGGGIGAPDEAVAYLDGSWAHRHGRPTMPLDGILIGTAAMACAEATTSPQVKRLLVDAPGTGSFISTGRVAGAVTSGRSQLGADLHEIDNAASRAGRLLDEVAGDGEAAIRRRAEIIEAIDATAKPYFGELAEMTYGQVLDRFVELCAIGRGGRYEDGAWLDRSWRSRFLELLHRVEARLCASERGTIPTVFGDERDLDDPGAALTIIRAHHREVDSTVLHPADVSWFVELCRRPGKPVPFVPIIDAEVRRWWRSDSLWQAHDDRYDADGVIVIPGPAALRAVRAVDEPVAALFNRFEAATVAALVEAGVEPVDAAQRRETHTDHRDRRGDDPISRLLAEPNVEWTTAGPDGLRRRRRPNPALAVAPATAWHLDASGNGHGPASVARAHRSDAVLVATGPNSVRLDVPLTVHRDTMSTASIEFDLSSDGRSAAVVSPRSSAAWSAALRCASVPMHGPDPTPDQTSATGTEFLLATALDHAALFGAASPLPDALVGPCWSAVFAALEREFDVSSGGFADLLHLDHHLELHGGSTPTRPALPDTDGNLDIDVRVESNTATSAGRAVAVRIELANAHAKVATLHERFLIRSDIGKEPLGAPRALRLADDAAPTPRRTLADIEVNTPPNGIAMASFTGDHNPLHLSREVAAVAGFTAPIVHGMWVSAAMQQAARRSAAGTHGGTGVEVREWHANFVAPIPHDSPVSISVVRVARIDGGDVVEVQATVDGDLVATAAGVLSAPRTVYAFPGQGIQRVAMGLDALTRSAAARAVWERADHHTRSALGFSIRHVVRDNPVELVVDGERFRHPDGVLFLTQFTQVAMATLASAQIAELREAGGFVPDAIACGHSVGEYNALAAVTGILAVEDVLEVVYQRGLAMHHLVPRDAAGNSRYRMAAVRPSEAGLSESELRELVADLARDTDPEEFIQIVNFNLRGRQYAVAGTQAPLRRLHHELERRRAERNGKGVYVEVPGIDVPFHSAVLHHGVAGFRTKLDAILPDRIDPTLLVGRYIPNLVPRLFSLSRDFVVEVAEVAEAPALNSVIERWDDWSQRPEALCRVLLLELLAWQFASPVRWIETQDLVFALDSGIERFVEVGLESQPTISSLARQTLSGEPGRYAAVTVANLEADRAELFGEDTDPPFDELAEAADDGRERAGEAGAEEPPSPSAPTAPAGATSAASAAGAAVAPEDLAWTPADGLRFMLSWWTKVRIDQLADDDTIESLVDGASSRRNQLLMDIGKEFGLGAIDGAADAALSTLIDEVAARARTYRAPGPVLRPTIDEQLRRVTGPARSRPRAIDERIANHWGLGAGWTTVVAAAVAAGTRAGTSVRGGDLATLSPTEPASAEDLDGILDAAVTAVARASGVEVAPLVAPGGSDALDAATATALLDTIIGADGVLTEIGRVITRRTSDAPTGDSSFELQQTQRLHDIAAAVTRELGAGWQAAVAPAFDPARTLVIDDRWAGQREDLARLANSDPDPDRDRTDRERRFARLGRGLAPSAIGHARWHEREARRRGDVDLADRLARLVAESAATAVRTDDLSDDVALVTGASPGSIAAGIVAELLGRGATVIATASSLTSERIAFFRELYHDHAHHRASLWLAPANLASFSDVDRLVEWLGTDVDEATGGEPRIVKPALTPTLVFPFAAPAVRGDLSEVGPSAELEMRVLLWSVERLIAALAEPDSGRDPATRLHVVLPGSPNRGTFGGDGAYGEAKAALDALTTRQAHEPWGERVSIVHAIIGWVRGTGLMSGNDALVPLVETEGIGTWSAEEIARELVDLGDRDHRHASGGALTVDLSRGLWNSTIDLADLAAQARDLASAADIAAVEPAAPDSPVLIDALPHPPSAPAPTGIDWPALDLTPADTVVIVGFGEVGPLGSARTRFDVEVTDSLSAGAVAELAWMCGLIRWESTPTPGFYDVESGELVAEHLIAERYEQRLLDNSGVRFLDDDGAQVDGTAPLLASVFLERDLSFVVESEAQAEAFVAADPDRTSATPNADGTFTVTRSAGTEIRVPRRTVLPRRVAAQLPAGFDPSVYGIPSDMIEALDRVAVWSLVATVDAFVDAGIEPAELLSWVHPTEVANTQGTGIGGISAIRRMYVDSLLGDEAPNDILQEALPNVVAAHVMQSYVGGYGAMIHPVAACATAAVSLEEAFDKIRSGRAAVVVAGGFDDFGHEGLIGFAAMNATASSDAMEAAGIEARRMSRANDRRRAGFVEGQGGGTVVVARGDIAYELGLPVRGVIAWAGSFSDGINTSIPAPGLGLIGAVRGGGASPLARALRSLGLDADDIAVVSKHDTSTAANDPNESLIHERLSSALGRHEDNPLYVISQKTVTGHAKGGAAAFQTNGLCQVLESGAIPPNRSLDCVDGDLERYARLVWPTEPLHHRGSLRAGLLTSLGFGHVAAIVAIVHPEAFVATIEPDRRDDYRRRAAQRSERGQRRRVAARVGGAPLYVRPDHRLGDRPAARRDLEAAMLVDPDARLGPDGTYRVPTIDQAAS
ncbi:MAG: DUF1729 domain-containing protein [Microthrixaceae bacterium]|nr:DUF1729 domain-containing protein [Microthrixaceae bacterium]